MLFRDIEKTSSSLDNRGESYAADHPDVLDYQGSDIQSGAPIFLSHFSEQEQNALIKTYKSDDAYQKPIVFGRKNTSVDFDASENIFEWRPDLSQRRQTIRITDFQTTQIEPQPWPGRTPCGGCVLPILPPILWMWAWSLPPAH